MAKTSIHIKPCNIGQSEAHNKRAKEYLAHINADKLYIREDLTSCNQSWIADQQQELSLQQYYDNIGKMVKEKTGRAMQTKEREKVNKKTGKIFIMMKDILQPPMILPHGSPTIMPISSGTG